jgi:hypothetical protein
MPRQQFELVKKANELLELFQRNPVLFYGLGYNHSNNLKSKDV